MRLSPDAASIRVCTVTAPSESRVGKISGRRSAPDGAGMGRREMRCRDACGETQFRSRELANAECVIGSVQSRCTAESAPPLQRAKARYTLAMLSLDGPARYVL